MNHRLLVIAWALYSYQPRCGFLHNIRPVNIPGIIRVEAHYTTLTLREITQIKMPADKP